MTDKERMYANPLEWKLMVAKSTGHTKVTYDELNGLVETIKSQQAEIERLQIRLRKVRNQFTDLSKMHSEIKAEAIKEFAEKLKKKIGDSHFQNYGLAILEIQDLVKEMVGEDK